VTQPTSKKLVFHADSGAPWHISCAVNQVGSDYVCHIHGGDWHVGAVALSQWRGDRADTACLIVGIHKEEEIAVCTASHLCDSTHRSVVCIAGIHFDGITKRDIQDISRAANELAARAAKHLTP
jgi:hypothetical protein